jgi:hypothetical protein
MNDYKYHFCLATFRDLEEQLRHCLEYIPFIRANENVVSPKFVPIIFEACSLVDSVFTEMSGSGSERYNIRKHCENYESRLQFEDRLSLCLISPLQVLQPFQGWTTTSPLWWQAYNSLKHDRLNNYPVATNRNAIMSMCALHQVMASFRDFIGGFLQLGWVDQSDEDVATDIGTAPYVGHFPSVIVQSQLFATPSPTMDNFIIFNGSDRENFDLDWQTSGLTQRVRDLMSAHLDWR